MRLSVVIPSYNRAHLLQRTLESLLAAAVPADLTIEVLVIDNNSKDNTVDVVAAMKPKFKTLSLRYVLETKQGLSNARNGGIAAADKPDLLGFIDDDEEVRQDWLEVIAREFADPAIDFIGGPYLPNWVSPEPDWLPPGYHAVIGAIPPKERAAFDESFSGNLMGGNAVFRRSVFDRVGTYAPHLGRSGKGLLSDEDAELFRRLIAARIPGVYVPDLAILHYIAPERLTRKYHRSWAYWRAVSQGVADRDTREPVAYLFGLPRHRIGRALRSIPQAAFGYLRRGGSAQAFADELAIWELIGFAYGKRFLHVERLYPDRAKPNGSVAA